MNQKQEEQLADYQKRVHAVFEYIDTHLDSPLKLEALAEIAHFSPYHFHRIFKQITHETVNEYITRRRVESAALDLLHSKLSAAEIAHQYGFSEPSAFSRAFKKYFKVSPTQFIEDNPYKHSKIRQLKSKIGQAYPDQDQYLAAMKELNNWIAMNGQIEVKEMPEMKVAYVPVKGVQALPQAYGQLMQWAGPRGLMHEQTKMITQYHDSFKVTTPDQIRMSACLVLQEDIQPEGVISRKALPATKCIVGHFEIGMEAFEKAWTGLFLWMNEHGYKKSDEDPFGIYYNDFNQHPEKKAIVDLCIPIAYIA